MNLQVVEDRVRLLQELEELDVDEKSAVNSLIEYLTVSSLSRTSSILLFSFSTYLLLSGVEMKCLIPFHIIQIICFTYMFSFLCRSCAQFSSTI